MNSPTDGPSHRALRGALAMVGDDGTSPAAIRFTHTSRLAELTEEGGPWHRHRPGDAPDHTKLVQFEDPFTLLRLTPDSADTSLTVTPDVTGILLLNGGQDVAGIEERARLRGWVGEGPLLVYEGPQPNFQRGFQVLFRGGDSVATGNWDLDLSVVDSDGPTLADNPTVTLLRNCLGDAVHAVFRPESAVGVLDGEDGPYSVVCSLHQDADTAWRFGRRDGEEQRYDGSFSTAHHTVHEIGGMAVLRAVLTPRDGTPLTAILPGG